MHYEVYTANNCPTTMSYYTCVFYSKYFAYFFENGTDVHLWPNLEKPKYTNTPKTSVPTTGILQELGTYYIRF